MHNYKKKRNVEYQSYTDLHHYLNKYAEPTN